MNIVYGVFGTFFSGVIALSAKYIGMQSIMVLMLMGAFAHSTFMVSWVASSAQSNVVFMMAIILAFTNSLATSQVRGNEK